MHISKLAAEAFDGLGYLRAALFICIHLYGAEWALSVDYLSTDMVVSLSMYKVLALKLRWRDC